MRSKIQILKPTTSFATPSKPARAGPWWQTWRGRSSPTSRAAPHCCWAVNPPEPNWVQRSLALLFSADPVKSARPRPARPGDTQLAAAISLVASGILRSIQRRPPPDSMPIASHEDDSDSCLSAVPFSPGPSQDAHCSLQRRLSPALRPAADPLPSF